ncbi:hypothetical protein JTE90_019384 [Oedothorax gibbosus]|uniref:Uncharacterized protein n=1 Tax=Oedothorax gibbosus TaxID=931172 RepID=A0AAV6UDN2_9ARAC|nr:hypothetical protein JTE90_019384 [Oedothorax gibbosus]
MASIGRWLYRLFAICLPCLKSSEADEKETEDYRQDLNPFENIAEENAELGNEYPDDLNPFGCEEDEENKNLNGKEEKGQQEDEYPDSLNPFTSDDEESEQENDYPQELNPFTDDEVNEQENDYPDELNPFADEKDDKADTAIVNQCSLELSPELNSPAINGSSSTVPLPNEEKVDDGKDESEQQEDEYPDCLNPFAIEAEENEQHDDDYPDQLNPFFDEGGDAADTAKVNQCSKELASEQTPPAINGSSSTVPLPIDEKAEYGRDESEKQEEEYPDSLNPFASEDDENQYPEELNPFANDAADTAKVNQSSPELAELTLPAINGSSATSPLAYKRKAKSFKKRRAPDPPVIERVIPNEESAPGVSKTLGSLPIIYKVKDYDEALKRFASEDEEATGDTTGKQSSLAQLTAATIDGCSSLNVSSKGKNKGNSFKKRRAPDPPVIESKDSASSDIKSNQSSASSFHPGIEKSEAQKKSPAIPDRKSP